MSKPMFTAAVFAATFLAAGAQAQTQDNAAPVATPSTPAPTVVAAPPPAAPVQTAPVAAPNQIIYSPRLPSPAELTNAAAAQGVTVERIEQNPSQVTVTYRYSNGQANTVAYQLLPTGTASAPVQTTVIQAAPAPAVVYAPPPRVIYYEEPIYYPRYYYPPVSLSFGFGYHHFSHGGYRHWR